MWGEQCRSAEIAGSIKAADAASCVWLLWRSTSSVRGELDCNSRAGMISSGKTRVTASRKLHSSVIERMRSTRYRRD
jgi:hypothetical protein